MNIEQINKECRISNDHDNFIILNSPPERSSRAGLFGIRYSFGSKGALFPVSAEFAGNRKTHTILIPDFYLTHTAVRLNKSLKLCL